MSARLYIPRALVVLTGSLSLLLIAGGIRSVGVRLTLVADSPQRLRLGFALGFVLAGLAVAMGLLLVRTTLRWGTYRVVIGPDGVDARLLRRAVRWPAAELKGVVLRQDGGVPELRLVSRHGDVEVFPGWSLRARWDDGEVEDAGPALQTLGSRLGFGVKHRTILSTPVSPPPPPTGRRSP